MTTRGQTGSDIRRRLRVIAQSEIHHGVAGKGAIQVGSESAQGIVAGRATASDTLVMTLTGDTRGNGMEAGRRGRIEAHGDIVATNVRATMAIDAGNRGTATGPVTRLSGSVTAVGAGTVAGVDADLRSGGAGHDVVQRAVGGGVVIMTIGTVRAGHINGISKVSSMGATARRPAAVQRRGCHLATAVTVGAG